MRTPFIIAEAGSCHEEQYERALALIDTAKGCNADAVKFQYWSSPARMRERRAVSDVQVYEKGSVAAGWLPELSKAAHAAGLEFMCTSYLPEDIEHVAPFVDRFKVASFEADDEKFVNAHRLAAPDKMVVISAGMIDDRMPRIIPARGVVLQCVSAYPTPLTEASISAMRNMYRCVGYSDHTRCIYTGGFAVSAGADMLEVHFRLGDTSPECADFPVALSPDGLEQYVMLARLAHVMRGDGVKRVQPSEQVNLKHRVRS